MTKVVLLIVVVIAVLWLMLGTRRRSRTSTVSDDLRQAQATSARMLACAHCGVHVPASEAVTHLGHSYCCGAHADAGPGP